MWRQDTPMRMVLFSSILLFSLDVRGIVFFVKPSYGELMMFTGFDQNDTVATLKQSIASKIGLSKFYGRLTFNNMLLADDANTLAQERITNDSTLHLALTLFDVIKTDNTRDVEQFLIFTKQGIDINTRDQSSGLTPLEDALWNRHWQAADLLLQKGANPNAGPSNVLRAALKWAGDSRSELYSRAIPMAKKLLANGLIVTKEIREETSQLLAGFSPNTRAYCLALLQPNKNMLNKLTEECVQELRKKPFLASLFWPALKRFVGEILKVSTVTDKDCRDIERLLLRAQLGINDFH